MKESSLATGGSLTGSTVMFTVAIPEFPNVARPIGTAIGMLIVMGRKKKRKVLKGFERSEDV